MVAEDSGDFPIDRLDIRDVAGADGLMYDVEGLSSQHGQIFHGGADGLDVIAASSAFAQIQFQHGVAEVDNGNDGAGGCVQD